MGSDFIFVKENSVLKTTVVRDGYKFIGTAMFVAILAYYFYGYSMAIIPSVFAGYFTYFFRNEAFA